MILINEALIIESETDLVEFLADVKNNLPEQDKDKVFKNYHFTIKGKIR